MRIKLLLFCIFGSVGLIKSQIDPALSSLLQNELNRQVATAGNHGVSAYLILQNGETWSGAAGVNGFNQPITDSTVYIAASISKLNIATLLLLFAEEGIINLEDTWRSYLPNLNVSIDTNITIRQLLNHTSGIADYLEVPANSHYVTDNFSHFYTPEYIMENIVNAVPDFSAGTNFNYSNSNYCLAAMIAEAATGNSLAYELRTRIWNPLGMNHTYFGAYESINDPRAGIWWNFTNGSGVTNYSMQSDTAMLSFGYGTDNVVTCPTDLAKLVHAITNNQLLSAQSYTEMKQYVPESFPQWTGGYGLGFHHLFAQVVDTVLGHNGKYLNNSDVFHSEMCGFTLCVMSNTKTLWEGIYNPMYNILRNYFQCNLIPVANFYANTKVACTGAMIVFRDSSTNVRPTAWAWDFPGGTLVNGTTVNDSIPNVVYNAPGVYAVTYTASTSAGGNTVTKTNYITINSNTAVHNSSFYEGFEAAMLPNVDWDISSDLGNNWSITNLGAATGNKAIYIDNFNNQSGNKSRLNSSTFDLSSFTTPRLSFKAAYQQKVSTNSDKLQVFTSTNCGVSWTLRLSKSGSSLANIIPPSTIPLMPTVSQFTTYTVSLNGVAGSSNVLFRFEFSAGTNGPGNNIFIDDINIFDAAVVGLENYSSLIDFRMYPNPSSSEVTLNFILNKKQNISIVVRDLLGRIIEQIPTKLYESGDSKIKLSQKSIYESGIYFVTIEVEGVLITKKLVIE